MKSSITTLALLAFIAADMATASQIYLKNRISHRVSEGNNDVVGPDGIETGLIVHDDGKPMTERDREVQPQIKSPCIQTIRKKGDTTTPTCEAKKAKSE